MSDINMPKLSDTMEEGQIAVWKKKSGDQVKSGEVLAEVESDKATFDLESDADGTLQILVEQGVPAKVGAPIARIGEAGAAPPAPQVGPPPSKGGPAAEQKASAPPAPQAAPPPPEGGGQAPAPQAAPSADALPLGDLVICAPVISREAREQRKSFDAHWAHIVVHGVLHLLGYDHESEEQAQTMEDRERKILAGLGFRDPYALRD
jgi:rRNA maturation RNase YbeY